MRNFGLKCLILFGITLCVLFLPVLSIAQNKDNGIIEQIKRDGPGKRFVIIQIKPIKGHEFTGYEPVTFTGNSIKGDLSWVVDGVTAAGNGTVIRFTSKMAFQDEIVYLGPTKVYLPKNIKGFIFESQPDDPLTFVLLENYGLVCISGCGSVTYPDSQIAKLVNGNLKSLETPKITLDSVSDIAAQLKSTDKYQKSTGKHQIQINTIPSNLKVYIGPGDEFLKRGGAVIPFEQIEQIKRNGPGNRFVIAQIQPIKGHKFISDHPITFKGNSIEATADALSGVVNRITMATMAGNGTVIRFTSKVAFQDEIIYSGTNEKYFDEIIYSGTKKVYLPKNIKGFIFESQPDDPLTFVLLENYGLVCISGCGSVTYPDSQIAKLVNGNLKSLETPKITLDSVPDIEAQLKSTVKDGHQINIVSPITGRFNHKYKMFNDVPLKQPSFNYYALGKQNDECVSQQNKPKDNICNIIKEEYYAGTTPITVNLDSGCYTIILQSPSNTDTAVFQEIFNKWDNEFKNTYQVSLLTAATERSIKFKIPNLIAEPSSPTFFSIAGDCCSLIYWESEIEKESHYITSFSKDRFLKWIAKSYEVKVSDSSPKVLNINFYY